jgi:tRNA pseudouridine55 synthase
MDKDVSGMILFDKPPGWTSHDAVSALRRLLPKNEKAGHCGTLDPLATGLLIVLAGRTRKLQAHMQGLDKVYYGTIQLGLATDTGDVAGKILAQLPIPELNLADIQKILDGYHGAVSLPAPIFSAVKHKGKPLYHYARKGIATPPKPRTCTVYNWEALSYSPETGEIENRLFCSSGTYVRSLAEAIGSKIGCGAVVKTLRREQIGPFSISEAINLDELKKLNAVALEGLFEKGMTRLFDAAAKIKK